MPLPIPVPVWGRWTRGFWAAGYRRVVGVCVGKWAAFDRQFLLLERWASSSWFLEVALWGRPWALEDVTVEAQKRFWGSRLRRRFSAERGGIWTLPGRFWLLWCWLFHHHPALPFPALGIWGFEGVQTWNLGRALEGDACGMWLPLVMAVTGLEWTRWSTCVKLRLCIPCWVSAARPGACTLAPRKCRGTAGHGPSERGGVVCGVSGPLPASWRSLRESRLHGPSFAAEPPALVLRRGWHGGGSWSLFRESGKTQDVHSPLWWAAGQACGCSPAVLAQGHTLGTSVCVLLGEQRA